MTVLSADARRLLQYLRDNRARSAAAAITDHAIAAATGLPYRDIIDLSQELLDAGIACMASTRSPYGRWILEDGEDLLPLLTYMRSIESRHAAMHRRYMALKRIYERRRAGPRSSDPTGQTNLFSLSEPTA